MSTKTLSPWPRVRFMDDDGNPLAGGKLYTYRTGTSSNKATYSDADGTQNANPVILDADGYADLWLDDDEPYRFRLETSAGVLVWQRDNMTAASGNITRAVATIAALKLIAGSATATTIVNVGGYYATGDGGGGQFWWDSASTATDDGGAIIQATGITTGRWKRIFNGFITVQHFGAKGDGSNIDSDAFQAALDYAESSGIRKVYVPGTTTYYKVSGVDVPFGVGMEGIGWRKVYSVNSGVSDMEGTCAVVYDTGGGDAYMFTYAGRNTCRYLNFYGVNDTIDGLGVSAGTNLVFECCGFFRFRYGIADNGYTNNSRFLLCTANRNTMGIRNLVDSHVIHCEVADNSNRGVDMQTGANDTTFTGCKVEFNDSLNWNFFEAVNNVIQGGVCDRSEGDYGLSAINSRLILSNVVFRRNGAATTTGSAHIYLDGSDNLITVNGCQFRIGENDGGGGNITPAHVFRGNGVGTLLVNGCTFVDGYVDSIDYSTAAATLAFSGCDLLFDNLRPIVSAFNSAVASGGGTLDGIATGVNVLSLSTQTATIRRYRLQISTRNASTNAVKINEMLIAVQRGGTGNATAAVYWVADSASTDINTTGATVNVTLGSVTADGTSFTVTATNTGGSNLQIRFAVTPYN